MSEVNESGYSRGNKVEGKNPELTASHEAQKQLEAGKADKACRQHTQKQRRHAYVAFEAIDVTNVQNECTNNCGQR